jgi:hypothetical protein
MGVKMEATSTAIDKVVRSVLAKSGVLGAKEIAAWKRPKDDIRRLCQRDYPATVRRRLSSNQIDEMVRRAREIWPHFNREVLGPPSPGFFSRAANALQLHFKAARYSSLALYGFYVDRTNTSLAKPLIFINSSHHALAIGTAFCHEVGHHFSAEVGEHHKPNGISFYFDADYSGHLRDKGELFADVVVSLAGYPKSAAKAIFAQPKGKSMGKRGLDYEMIERIRKHIAGSYGFDFSASLSPRQNLQYLAGMLHYAKLRAALLDQFDI